MKRLTVGKMDLFDLLRRVVYPTLEENLDEAFPEFEFKKASHGWWVARNSPSAYREYGHSKGRLVARSWGFRSLNPGHKPIFWLGYCNKQSFPGKHELGAAIQNLAGRVKISCDWTLSVEETETAGERVRRQLMLEALLVHFQSNLWTVDGRAARKFLTETVGIPEAKIMTYELGLYLSIGEARQALAASGLDSSGDHERAAATGIYQPNWEDRIIGPWRDRFGRTVFNLWSRGFPDPFGELGQFQHLRPIELKSPIGSQDVPLFLHVAARNKQKKLLLVENPFSALLPLSLGLQNPCPIAIGDRLLEEQVAVIQKYLQSGDGELTLNLGFDPDANGGIHGPTFDAMDMFRNATFPLHVIDPVHLAGASDIPGPIEPDGFIREKGIKAYIEILKKRVPSDRFVPMEYEEDEERPGLF